MSTSLAEKPTTGVAWQEWTDPSAPTGKRKLEHNERDAIDFGTLLISNLAHDRGNDEAET